LSNLTVTSSPHIRDNISTQKIMLCVIVALLPTVIASGIYFGLKSIILTIVCVGFSALTEFICCKIMKREQTISDLSACVTGLILSLNLPVTLPLWQAIIGCIVSIVIAKQLFGGIGKNFINPAIVGKIVLLIFFNADMTTWTATRFSQSLAENESYMDLFLGNVGSYIGATSALALLIGGIFLIFTRIVSPSAPISFIGMVAIFTFISGGDVLSQVLSGGLLLGAFFMATDYATTPITENGKIIFGIGCGIITFVIAHFGKYSESVPLAILLMNILTPLIDKFTIIKPFGAKYPEKKNEKEKV